MSIRNYNRYIRIHGYPRQAHKPILLPHYSGLGRRLDTCYQWLLRQLRRLHAVAWILIMLCILLLVLIPTSCSDDPLVIQSLDPSFSTAQTGSATPTIGTNSPATAGDPDHWIRITLPDGHIGWFPVWE